jgi:hypothetical protein
MFRPSFFVQKQKKLVDQEASMVDRMCGIRLLQRLVEEKRQIRSPEETAGKGILKWSSKEMIRR